MADHYSSPDRQSRESKLGAPSAPATLAPRRSAADDRPPASGPKRRELSFVMTGEGALVFGGNALAEAIGFAEGQPLASILEVMTQEEAVVLFATVSQLDCGLAGRTRIRIRVRDAAGRFSSLAGTAQAEYGGTVGRSYFLRFRLDR